MRTYLRDMINKLSLLIGLFCCLTNLWAGPPAPFGLMDKERFPIIDSPPEAYAYSTAYSPLRQAAEEAFGAAALTPGTIVNQTGTRRLLVVLVEFDDITGGVGYPDLTLPVGTTANQWQQWAFGGRPSVAHYFSEVSGGRLNITAAQETSGTANDGIVDWIHMSADPIWKTHPTHPPDRFVDIGAWSNSLASAVINYVSDNGLVDFSLFDDNSDGSIGYEELLLVMVLAGYDGSWTNSQSPSVWPHAYRFAAISAPTVNGVKVCASYGAGDIRTGTYAFVGEWVVSSPDAGPANGHMFQIGQACHEIGHQFFLPEGYDTTFQSKGAGRFCVMAYGSWNYETNPADSPAHPAAWIKYRLGWTEAVTAAASSTYSLTSLGTNHQTLVVQSPSMDTEEFFLIENRQHEGYDDALTGSAGLLVWHVDEGQNDNGDRTHFLYDLEEASGTQDLEVWPGSYGDENDYYRSGGLTDFTPATVPNTNAFSGTGTNVAMRASSPSAASMNVIVNYDGALPATSSLSGGGGGGGCSVAQNVVSPSAQLLLLWFSPLFVHFLRRR